MPKIKTRRAAAKRFSRTATGKIKRRKAFKSHILSKMGTKRKRQLRRQAFVHSANLDQVERMLPN